MIKKEDEIIIRSEEFHDVLGNIPPWIVRRGIMVLAIIVVILLAGSAVFKYPDTISATMILTGDTPPAIIVSKVSGKLRELYVVDNQMVSENERLAVIDNPARTKDVLELKRFINTIDLNVVKIDSLPSQHLILGDLQSLYSSFYSSVFDYIRYNQLDYYDLKSNLLMDRIQHYDSQYNNSIKQKEIIRNQLIIAENQLQRDSLLNKKGILSDEEFEGAKGRYLQAALSLENISTTLKNLQIQKSQVKESLFDINFQSNDKRNAMQLQIKTLINQLRGEIQTWEMNYVISSPIDGKVTFNNYWIINQNIIQGSVVFNVIPNNIEKIIGKASLPIIRSGKVKIGQVVNIQFDNFPDQEYGIVKGIVKSISLVPIKENESISYTVEIELPNRLKTTYKKELPYLPEMRGNIDIITDDITLLERLFMPIKKIINERL